MIIIHDSLVRSPLIANNKDLKQLEQNGNLLAQVKKAQKGQGAACSGTTQSTDTLCLSLLLPIPSFTLPNFLSLLFLVSWFKSLLLQIGFLSFVGRIAIWWEEQAILDSSFMCHPRDGLIQVKCSLLPSNSVLSCIPAWPASSPLWSREQALLLGERRHAKSCYVLCCGIPH